MNKLDCRDSPNSVYYCLLGPITLHLSMVRLHVHEWGDRCLVVTVCDSTHGKQICGTWTINWRRDLPEINEVFVKKWRIEHQHSETKTQYNTMMDMSWYEIGPSGCKAHQVSRYPRYQLFVTPRRVFSSLFFQRKSQVYKSKYRCNVDAIYV